jgi:hypothetical protein
MKFRTTLKLAGKTATGICGAGSRLTYSYMGI